MNKDLCVCKATFSIPFEKSSLINAYCKKKKKASMDNICREVLVLLLHVGICVSAEETEMLNSREQY